MQRLHHFHKKASNLSYQFYPKCIISGFNKSVSDAAHIIPYHLCQESGYEDLAYDSRNLITLAKHLHVGFEIANGKIPTFTLRVIEPQQDFIKTEVRLPPFKDLTLPEFLYEGKEILIRGESLPYIIAHNIIFNHSWGIKSEKIQLNEEFPLNKKLSQIIEYFKKKMCEKYNNYDSENLHQHLNDKISESRKSSDLKKKDLSPPRKITQQINKVMKVNNNFSKHKLKDKLPKNIAYVTEIAGKRNSKGKNEYRVLWHDCKRHSWVPEKNISPDLVKKYEKLINDDEYEDIEPIEDNTLQIEEKDIQFDLNKISN